MPLIIKKQKHEEYKCFSKENHLSAQLSKWRKKVKVSGLEKRQHQIFRRAKERKE